MPKGRHLARVSYDDNFVPELEKFLELIYLDKDIDKVVEHKTKQRFSAAIRWLIAYYNTNKGPKIIEGYKKDKSLSPSP